LRLIGNIGPCFGQFSNIFRIPGWESFRKKEIEKEKEKVENTDNRTSPID
jgi:hypothetical protein